METVNETTDMTQQQPKDEYEGTEDSRFGKIVVLQECEPVGDDISDIVMTLTAEGPAGKGFRSSAEAVEEIKLRCQRDYDNDVDPLPVYHVVRLVKRIAPKKVQKTVLDFGE